MQNNNCVVLRSSRATVACRQPPNVIHSFQAGEKGDTCDPETFLLAIMGCGASVATETQEKRVETGKVGSVDFILASLTHPEKRCKNTMTSN